MKIGFIAGRPQKSFECLSKRAALRGYVVEHVPVADMPLSFDGVTEFVKKCARNYEVLHYYVGLADPIGVAFGQICDELGIPLLNNKAHIPQLVHSKMFQTLNFSRAGLPIPKTEFTRTPKWDKLSSSLGDPIVAKRARGTHGKHVHIIRNQEDLSVVDRPSEYLFQEYLPHRNDVRVLVLDNQSVCGYRRVPSSGDFRANLARGGYAEPLVDEKERETVFSLAEEAVRAIPHEFAGVDIIRSDKDGIYRLIEINTNPSWYGIVESTNTHFEDALLDKYEKLATARNKENLAGIQA